MLVHYCRNDATLTQSGSGQVFCDSASGKTAFLVGHIHNVGELKHQLMGGGRLSGNPTEVELSLEAYRIWGRLCPEKLLGEFALVIVDPTRGEVFCARDPIGVKPFFYHLSEKNFIFGSTVHAIIEDAAVPQGVCNEAVAIYLKYGELYHPRLTFHESIKKLPPASTLLITEDGSTEEIYWRAEEVPRVEYQSVDDCAQKLGELVSDAVRVRLPGGEPIAAHLSGGLDSSTISAIAGKQLGVSKQQLHTFSWMAPPQNDEELANPEWAQSRKIADHAGSVHHYTNFSGDELFDILTSHNIADHDTVDLWYEFGVRDIAKNLGVQTILSGWGGDQFITNYGKYRYVDTFWHGHPLITLRDLIRTTSGQRNRLAKFTSLCWRELVVPVLPRWFPGKGKDYYSLEYLAATTAGFEQYARQATRSKPPSSIWSVREDQLVQYTQGHLQNRLESWAVSGEAQGLEYRYPLLDRRIVEFALSIPPELYRQKGAPRYIFRRAVSGFVPQEVWRDYLKLETTRVHRLVQAGRSALLRWREDHQRTTSTNPYIDISRLYRLIDEVLERPLSLEVSDIVQVMTAIKSIMVLNMQIGKSDSLSSTENPI